MLVTGGAGFIGSNLVRALLERGDRVRVLDNFSTGLRANLAELADDVELVEGDLRSYERVHAAVRGVEVVFHQGALPSVPRSVQDPLTTTAVNVEGTLNVLLAARDEGVRRVVSASSSSVYGNGGRAPAHGGPVPRPDLSVRGREARGGALLHELQPRLPDRDGRRCATSTSSGRGRTRTRSTRPSCRASSPRSPTGRPITIHGDGEQSRDFTYVDNVVAANLLAADAADVERRDPQRRHRQLRDRQRARRHDRPAARQAGREAVRAGARGGRARLVGGHLAARERLGFEPQVSLEDGPAANDRARSTEG